MAATRHRRPASASSATSTSARARRPPRSCAGPRSGPGWSAWSATGRTGARCSRRDPLCVGAGARPDRGARRAAGRWPAPTGRLRRRRLVRPAAHSTARRGSPSTTTWCARVGGALALRGAVARPGATRRCASALAAWQRAARRGRVTPPRTGSAGRFTGAADGRAPGRGRAGRRADPGRRAVPGQRLHAARRPFAGSAAALVRGRAVSELRPARARSSARDRTAIVSLSPELFLRRRGRDVDRADQGHAAAHSPGNDAALRRSAKDAAENVMIVDLMRNDLGRVCVTGSVHVPARCSTSSRTPASGTSSRR